MVSISIDFTLLKEALMSQQWWNICQNFKHWFPNFQARTYGITYGRNYGAKLQCWVLNLYSLDPELLRRERWRIGPACIIIIIIIFISGYQKGHKSPLNWPP